MAAGLLLAEEDQRDADLEHWLQQGGCTKKGFTDLIKKQFPADSRTSLLPGFIVRKEWALLYRRLGNSAQDESFGVDLDFAEKIVSGLRRQGCKPKIKAVDLVSLFYGMFFSYLHSSELEGFASDTVINYLLQKIGEDLGLE